MVHSMLRPLIPDRSVTGIVRVDVHRCSLIGCSWASVLIRVNHVLLPPPIVRLLQSVVGVCGVVDLGGPTLCGNHTTRGNSCVGLSGASVSVKQIA